MFRPRFHLLRSLLRPSTRPPVRQTAIQSIRTRNCSCTAPAPAPPPSIPTSSQPPAADHRDIATAQQLLTTSPYSPGSPLFLPHGTRIFNKLLAYLRAQYTHYGFEEVVTPNIYKRTLWQTSGHWENYAEDMFEVSGRGSVGVKDDVAEEYGLKPMNCPGHCLLFKATAASRSLRDLPVRYADFSALHRNEISGALSGLTRVRRFHQDDGHIFCRPAQIGQEISRTLDFISKTYTAFQLPAASFVLSTRPENHIGSPESWDRAEAALRDALDASKLPWTLNEGDGAFYGPKIDVVLSDSDGKRHQTATIQLDFQLPERFGLRYAAPAPEAEARGETSTDAVELSKMGFVTPVLIHRAVLGSLERFMALLLEHYSGKFPFWLSPRQAIVLPVSNTTDILEVARKTQETLRDGGLDGAALQPRPMRSASFHVDIDERDITLGKKIKEARQKGYYWLVVVGARDVESGTVSLESGWKRDKPADVKKSWDAKELARWFVELEERYQ